MPNLPPDDTPEEIAFMLEKCAEAGLEVTQVSGPAEDLDALEHLETPPGSKGPVVTRLYARTPEGGIQRLRPVPGGPALRTGQYL